MKPSPNPEAKVRVNKLNFLGGKSKNVDLEDPKRNPRHRSRSNGKKTRRSSTKKGVTRGDRSKNVKK